MKKRPNEKGGTRNRQIIHEAERRSRMTEEKMREKMDYPLGKE